jgi:hypothetical protein
MPNTLNDAAAVPAALSAFLRGVERRGAVFGELQSGDREVGDGALAAAMRAFRNHAAALPMAEWSLRFWTLLVAAPPLRRDAATAQWSPDMQALAALESLPRQALLLRLVAGLAETDAAGVLGLTPAAYQQALAIACPRDVEGQADALAWRTLAEAIQQQLRDLPPERLARLARLREAAITGSRIDTAAAKTVAKAAPDQVRPSRWRWPWIVLVLALCALALAATWWWPHWQASHRLDGAPAPGAMRVEDAVDIRSEALPAQPPAATFDADMALVTHADFDLVLDEQEEAIARDADFYAWYGAARQAVAEDDGTVAHAEPAVPADGKETADAQF